MMLACLFQQVVCALPAKTSHTQNPFVACVCCMLLLYTDAADGLPCSSQGP